MSLSAFLIEVSEASEELNEQQHRQKEMMKRRRRR